MRFIRSSSSAGCAGLSLWGYIWIVSLAFQENSMQGVLCLFVPFYFLYWAFTHWEESNGPFALGISGMAIPLVFLVLAVSLHAFSQARLKNRSTGSGGTGEGANRELVREAEAIFKQDIKALDGLTNELARVKDLESMQQAGGDVQLAARMLKLAGNRSRHVKLRHPEWVALKHSVGPQLRSSLAALKQELTRINGIPGFRGKFGEAATALDKAIDFWIIKPGEETPPELVDGPALPIGPSPGTWRRTTWRRTVGSSSRSLRSWSTGSQSPLSAHACGIRR